MDNRESMRPIDTLVVAAHVIPVQPRAVLPDHAVAIDAGRILEVLPAAQALERYDAKRVVRLPVHALVPGFVNLHCHCAMTLLRGLADDLPLMDWLQNHIWPAEGQHVSPAFCEDGVRLACAEFIRGGVTTFNDMYMFPEATAAYAAVAVSAAAASDDFPASPPSARPHAVRAAASAAARARCEGTWRTRMMLSVSMKALEGGGVGVGGQDLSVFDGDDPVGVRGETDIVRHAEHARPMALRRTP